MIRPLPNDERLLDLLAAQAIGDLGPAELAGLQTLLKQHPHVAADELERAAALADVALAGEGDEPLPRALRERIAADAATHFVQQRSRAGSISPVARSGASEPRGVPGALVLSWMATAAAIVIAVIGWWPGVRPAPPPILTPVEAREQLLKAAPDAIVAKWQGKESAYNGVTGDVVWSPARQAGFIRLTGMPANVPTEKQYQLWIVDPARDKEPVDGGVFDVPPGGEVVLPVTAKLAVGSPQAFAITLEQRGGVVVSEGPLLVVAAVGS